MVSAWIERSWERKTSFDGGGVDIAILHPGIFRLSECVNVVVCSYLQYYHCSKSRARSALASWQLVRRGKRKASQSPVLPVSTTDLRYTQSFNCCLHFARYLSVWQICPVVLYLRLDVSRQQSAICSFPLTPLLPPEIDLNDEIESLRKQLHRI